MNPPCAHCHQEMKKTRRAKNNALGLLLLIVGLVTVPIGIGLLIAPIGLYFMSGAETLWECSTCRTSIPRKVKWYEWG